MNFLGNNGSKYVLTKDTKEAILNIELKRAVGVD